MMPLARRTGLSDEYKGMRDDADLGLAILVAEGVTGAYEPLAVVGTLREATATAQADLAARLRAVEGGRDPLCPAAYVVWARDFAGAYRRAYQVGPGEE